LALVLPVVVLLLLAVIQVALVGRDQLATVHAARVAARVAAVEPNGARVKASVDRAMPGARVEIGPRPEVGGLLEIVVVYRSITALPLVGPLMPDPELRVRATMRVER